VNHIFEHVAWVWGSAATTIEQSDYLIWWLAILQLIQTAGMQHDDYMPVLAMQVRVTDLLALSTSVRFQVAGTLESYQC